MSNIQLFDLLIHLTYQGVYIDKPTKETIRLDAERVVLQKIDEDSGEIIKVTLKQLFEMKTLELTSMTNDFENYIAQTVLDKHPYSNRFLNVEYELATKAL
jgi:hypothetical protein